MAASPIESTLLRPRPTRILVVDDDAVNGALIERLLGNAGMTIDQVLDSRKAVPLLRADEYSLVLLGHNMPALDGLTLLEDIRRMSSIPVVLLTGSDRSELAVRAIRLGAFDYLTKPVDEQRLLDTVRQAIESGAGAGDRIGHYEIQREIGRGGMGVVYAARDPRLDRTVALKILLPELGADPSFELKFLAEARTAAKFSHPNIVTVYQAGRFRGRLFMAMEFVPGETLEHFVRDGIPLPLPAVLDIGLQTAAALEVMHGAGMAHRDLKPANLMMTDRNVLKVLDFGLVRPVAAVSREPEEGEGDYSGTLAYAPPELLEKGVSDERGDLYALGVVLYELLAGARAFESRAMMDLMHRILESRLAIPLSELKSLPGTVMVFLSRLLAPKPEHRFASIGEVRAALKELRRGIRE